MEGYCEECIFEVNYGVMGGLGWDRREENVRVGHYWVYVENCGVNLAEVLDYPVNSIGFFTAKMGVLQGELKDLRRHFQSRLVMMDCRPKRLWVGSGYCGCEGKEEGVSKFDTSRWTFCKGWMGCVPDCGVFYVGR